MIKKIKYLTVIVSIILIITIILFIFINKKIGIVNYTSVQRFPRIYPEYCGTVIPPNIAPLNFLIKEAGKEYLVKIYSKVGKSIEIFSRKPIILISETSWRKLLNINRGEELLIDIFIKNNQWQHFKTIKNKIAPEDIDSYLVYRKIHPSHNTWREMGLYQRNLENYDETDILKNDMFKGGCIHCHDFNNRKPDNMSFLIRSKDYPSCFFIKNGNKIYKIDKKFGFTSWHPSGKILAYTVNKPPLILHRSKNEMRDIIDLDSFIGCYYLYSQECRTIPQLSQKEQLENYPLWSPDGKYLYFSSTKKLWNDDDKFPPDKYNQVKYSLFRISYNIEKDQWGEIETILLAKDTGLSINQSKISPDGHWLTFSMCEYSCWPSYHPDSDLYIMDLHEIGKTDGQIYKKMEINSDQCESWHSWSSNSRWIIFSSKKGNPLFNRLYIAYIDLNGHSTKALLIPQKDPTFYNSYLKTYTIPEFITVPVTASGEKLAQIIRGSGKAVTDLSVTGATQIKMD